MPSPNDNANTPPDPFADSGLSRIAALEARVSALEAELAAWRNLQVDPASGGGGVTFGVNQVFIRINSLTPASAQMP